jgi:DNA segregation ATPase FtsK/SpoIIIE, S-DNA-T family
LTAVLGRDIQGAPILCDLAKMPHLLIAGATGSGKSVCINSILMSILYRSSPEDVRMMMIDPKVVELNVYNGIPHLLAPVVTDPKKAANTLMWAVNEMTRRYGLFAEKSVRDINSYNASALCGDDDFEKLPLILFVIDELSDLMATTPTEVEDAIARLTAMARAAGIHLIIATQRPSVDVITGVIKANIPSRIAFAVASQVDSRTILDIGGAEKLLGKGDMLYDPQSSAKPIRGQGAFVTDSEVERVLTYIKTQHAANYDQAITDAIMTVLPTGKERDSSEQDELLPQAIGIVVETGYASVSLLQRRMNVGYPRAARLIDRMNEAGYVGPFEGSKPRKVLITHAQYLELMTREGN